MFDPKFEIPQLIFLSVGSLFICFSIFQFCYSKNKALPLLLLGTLFLSLFAITLDPFLNSWDEQYHALVAKNMSVSPFHPRLYPDPVLPYSHKHWTYNYTWVHKQPWFMWQMALFIKLFSATEIIIRIPSLICFLFATYSVYKIGKNLCNENIGYLSALLWSCNYFFYALMSGGQSTDQNDIVFICYTTISIWAFTEYVVAEKKTKWIILIGVFAGISVLTKWLSGLIVFSAFGIYTVLEYWPNIYKPKIYKNLFFSFLICILIAGSWQFYIFKRFPVEATYEFKMISKHFKKVVEGHGGSNWFYFENFSEAYGKLALLFVPIGLYAFCKFSVNKRTYFAHLLLILITYTFFTLAKTKMSAFPLICSAIIFVSFASGIYLFIDLFKKTHITQLITLFSISFICFFSIRFDQIRYNHSLLEENGIISEHRSNKLWWTRIFKNIKAPSQKAALFNCPYGIYVEAMFYSDFTSAYCGLPDAHYKDIIKKKGYRIFVLDNANLSFDERNDKDVTLITVPQFHIIKTDTVSILNEKKMALMSDPINKTLYFLATSTPQKYIINYFEDNSCSIKLLTGEYLTFDVFDEGSVLAGGTYFSFTNRFNILKEPDNFLRFETPFEASVKMDKNNYLTYGKNKDHLPLKLKIVS